MNFTADEQLEAGILLKITELDTYTLEFTFSISTDSNERESYYVVEDLEIDYVQLTEEVLEDTGYLLSIEQINILRTNEERFVEEIEELKVSDPYNVIFLD